MKLNYHLVVGIRAIIHQMWVLLSDNKINSYQYLSIIEEFK